MCWALWRSKHSRSYLIKLKITIETFDTKIHTFDGAVERVVWPNTNWHTPAMPLHAMVQLSFVKVLLSLWQITKGDKKHSKGIHVSCINQKYSMENWIFVNTIYSLLSCVMFVHWTHETLSFRIIFPISLSDTKFAASLRAQSRPRGNTIK